LNFEFELDLNSHIGSAPFTWRWLPFNEEFPYELDIGAICFHDLLDKVLPFDLETEGVFNDIFHIEITKTTLKVRKDLDQMDILSQTSMGASMIMELQLKDTHFLRVNFDQLEFLRPSFLARQLQFLDDFTARLTTLKFSSFPDDKGF